MSDLDLFSPGASPFDAIRHHGDGSGEWWSARELMPLLGYDRWDRVPDVIDRAAAAARNSGNNGADHFRGSSKMVEIGSGAERAIDDFHLTRFGAYLVAMNGDPRKPEIAAAQAYFAVQTHRAEHLAGDAGASPAQLDRRALALMVLEAEDAREEAEQRALAAESEAEALAPSAAAWDHLAEGDGDYSVADAAAILTRDPSIVSIGQNRLFTVMSDLGWVYRGHRDRRWRTYAAATDAGRLCEMPQSHYHPRTGELILDPPQVRVTAKGLAALRSHLAGR
jgi:DNA-damage-inducible protein D